MQRHIVNPQAKLFTQRANHIIITLACLMVALISTHPSTAAPVGMRVFAVTAGFYTVRDSVTWQEVQARWSGKDPMPIAVDLPTYFDLLGKLGVSLVAQIVIGDPVQWAWDHPDAWLIVPFDALSPRLKVLQIEGWDLFSNIDKYPLAYPSSQSNYDSTKFTTVALSGVTALTRGTGAMLDKNGVDWAVQNIRPAFANIDYVHTSNEVSFSDHCLRPGTQVTFGSFCSKESYFDTLPKAGINIVELTGNHNNDYGYEDALHTLDWYKASGIHTFGGGADQASAQTPLVVSHHGTTLTFVGCNSAGPPFAWATATTPGAARCNMEWLSPILKDPTVDVKIMSVQYVEYDQPWPIDEHRDAFRAYAEAGANVVIGTQSHRPQTFSFDGNRFIHYGLGNLFFDQTELQQRKFFIDKLTLYNGHLLNVTLLTGVIDDEARPRLMTQAERTRFLATMFYLSKSTNKSTDERP